MRDKQGRERFHGAFTGGYSAGYYNTVGTAEGNLSLSLLEYVSDPLVRGVQGSI